MTQVIVALDTSVDRAWELWKLLRDDVPVFKVGAAFLLQDGGQPLAREIAARSKLFLDLKLYDTRDTVLRTMDAVAFIGADLLTVHSDCVSYIEGECRVKILAVRRLTDGTGGRDPAVADGLICSVAEAGWRRPFTDKLLVCPGIRPFGSATDNHVSAATPRQAQDAGADYLVIGRPVYQADDPLAVVRGLWA